jgi:hypothetical protein
LPHGGAKHWWNEQGANCWEPISNEHPECFRVNAEDYKASLVWRRQFPRNVHLDDIREVVPDDGIDGSADDRVSRKPLQAGQITALIDVAVKLHDRAFEEHKARKSQISLVTAALAIVGGLLVPWVGKLGEGSVVVTIWVLYQGAQPNNPPNY